MDVNGILILKMYVNIDTEMVELAKNSIYYNLLSQKVNSEIQKIESAIKG